MTGRRGKGCAMGCKWLAGAVLLTAVAMFLLLIYPLVLPYSARRPEATRLQLSPGLITEEGVYFLAEYRVSRYRRPVWFIMPIERSPTVYYEGVFLYRFRAGDGTELERLAVLREDWPLPPQTTVRWAQLVESGNEIAMAYESGRNSDLELQYDLRVWDRVEGRLRNETEGEFVDRDDASFQKYFSGYASPPDANYGFVSMTDMRDALEPLDIDIWGFPDR